MTTMTTSREAAVRAIADALADRTSFVATVPPGMLATVADALARIPRWTAWLDCGLDTVLCVDDAHAITSTAALFAITRAPVLAVVTIPKTVPAKRLSRALGCPVPADGSRDVLIVGDGHEAPIAWPVLFLDALAHVDPAAAAQLRADAVAAS